MKRMILASVMVVALSSCGQDPLQSIGLRSSEWINEPTVPTTIAVSTTTPTIVSVSAMQWANDSFAPDKLEDVEALLLEVFERREGDRFVQASRSEIAAAVPDVAFPDVVPAGAQWISSQLVFESDGELSKEPTVAFGIWSAEPYTRSRSVAQMVVLRVFDDTVTANELATGEIEPSCAQFADRSSNSCELISQGSLRTWVLDESNGSTLVWYDRIYRYEMFGRSFVSEQVLRQMRDAMVPLTGIGTDAPDSTLP